MKTLRYIIRLKSGDEMEFEDYYFKIREDDVQDRLFVLVIYDIIDNAKRVRLAKKLQGYGFRVQKSAFEATITRKKYEKMLTELKQYVTPDDSIRVYKIIGKGQLTVLGKQVDNFQEDVIVI